jgi:hypothetical protein
MIRSPWPVTAGARHAFSAYRPGPTIGVSPTRPGGLPMLPPVDVAAARFP